MKYRRLLAVTLAAAVLGMGLAACSKDSDDETEKTEAPAEETEAVADTQGEGGTLAYEDLYCTLNGVDVYIGMPFEEVKDQLGDEIKPEERVEPCTGDCEYLCIIHTYDGFEINENYDGLVSSISVNTMNTGIGTGKFQDSFDYGAPIQEILDRYGEPWDQGDGYVQYSIGNAMLMFNSDDNVTITSFSIWDMTLGC